MRTLGKVNVTHMRLYRTLSRTLLASMLLVNIGCSTHMYTIKSDPTDADVLLNGKLVGRTPYSFPVESLPKDQDSILQINKEGIYTTQAVIPGGATALMSTEVLFTLPKKEPELQRLNRMSLILWRAQKYSGQGRYPEASKVVEEVLSEEPMLVSAHLLKASILFLSKNVNGAVTEWKRVLELDPANEEANRALRFTGRLEGGAAKNGTGR